MLGAISDRACVLSDSETLQVTTMKLMVVDEGWDSDHQPPDRHLRVNIDPAALIAPFVPVGPFGGGGGFFFSWRVREDLVAG